MRSFIVSLCCLLLLIAAWGCYSSYAEDEINGFRDMIQHSILTDVEAENWTQAESKFEHLESTWHKYKKIAHFFSDTDKLNEIDYSLAKAKYFIKAQDISNSSGELACLNEQLRFLRVDESLTFAGLF